MRTCRWIGCLHEWRVTEDGDAGKFDVLMQSDIPKAVDEIDQLPEVVEERLIRLLNFLHDNIIERDKPSGFVEHQNVIPGT